MGERRGERLQKGKIDDGHENAKKEETSSSRNNDASSVVVEQEEEEEEAIVEWWEVLMVPMTLGDVSSVDF